MVKTSKAQQPFWLGGAAASMAACFTHPLDQTKYRMQTQASKHNMLRAMFTFASRDGVRSLWSGLSASILRQSTYSTARFGLYNYLAREAQQMSGQKQLSSSRTIICAGLAGGIAGMIGNPTEVVLVRMCADGAKAPAQRFAYANAFDGLIRVWREEGPRTFARGLGPNITRSVLMNVSQIATYSAAKARLMSTGIFQDGIPVHFLASLLAGTVATTACAPADVLKSRIQNLVASGGQKPSLVKILGDSWRKEGPGFLMRGWTPAWLRLTPNTILMFIFMEQLQRIVDSFAQRPKMTIQANIT